VRADAVHLVEQAFSLFVQVPLDLEGGELVGHHPEPPAGPVRSPVLAVGEGLVGRGALVAGAEGAEPAPFLDALVLEVGGPLAAVGGDDHPSAGDRVFAQFWHVNSFAENPVEKMQ
jgi:hypothetical protein